jgi:bifunctional DNA-binding transcriptional regulator/antitoxin component of YhaV-PrlF toxin-antitoxin module
MPKIDTDDIVAMEDTHITVRGYRRRTTIPSGIFRFMELKDGDVIRWIATKDGNVFVSKLVK